MLFTTDMYCYLYVEHMADNMTIMLFVTAFFDEDRWFGKKNYMYIAFG